MIIKLIVEDLLLNIWVPTVISPLFITNANDPTIPALSQQDEPKFLEAKKNFEKYKNNFSFNEKFIHEGWKEKIPYQVDEDDLKFAVTGLPKSTAKEKYFIDIEKNNEEGKIVIRAFGRALHFDSKIGEFETYTALLWQKEMTGFAKFVSENIIRERSLGLIVSNSQKYIESLALTCVTKTNECEKEINKNEKKPQESLKVGSAFVARKEKYESIYYIATNAHVIGKTVNEYQRQLNKNQAEKNIATPEHFDLTKNHSIYATELSQFFQFVQDDQIFSRKNGKIKSVRLVKNAAKNDDPSITSDKFVETDLALLKIEFSSPDIDPFKRWWDARPTKTRKMNISDFLNAYDATNAGDRASDSDVTLLLEKGVQLMQPFFVGSYGSQDPLCHGKNNTPIKKFKMHASHSRNDWRIQSSIWNDNKGFSPKIGRINYLNRRDRVFFGSSGSAIYDKNLNIVGINFAGTVKLTQEQKNDESLCTLSTQFFKNLFQWFSFDQEAKDFFTLKDQPEALDYITKDPKWSKDSLVAKQTNYPFYDHSSWIFERTEPVDITDDEDESMEFHMMLDLLEDVVKKSKALKEAKSVKS